MKKINFKRICASVLAGTMLTGFGLNTNALADNNQRIEKFLLTEDEYNDPNYSYIINDDYENLFSEDEVIIYNQIIRSILNQEEVILMGEDNDVNLNIGEAIYNSPYNMLLENMGYDTDTHELIFYYLFTKNEQNEKLNFVNEGMNNLRNELFEDDMNNLDKLIVLNNYVANKFSYSLSYPSQFILEGNTLRIPLYYLLATNNGVCHTFSYFIDYMCQLEGIESYLITGYLGKTAHMWNMVKLDDNYYFIDSTTALTKGKALRNVFICFGMNKQEHDMYDYKVPKKYALKSIPIRVKTLKDEFRGYRNAEYIGNHVFKMTTRSDEIVYLNTETRTISDSIDNNKVNYKLHTK